MMGRGVAPCGHEGEVIVGTYVRCSACDGAKKPSAIGSSRIVAIEFVTDRAERIRVERRNANVYIDHIWRSESKLLHTHLLDADGQVVRTYPWTSPVYPKPGDLLRTPIVD